MISALKYKFQQQNVMSDIHKSGESEQNIKIHVNVLNQYHLSEDVAVQTIHGATINYSYTIKKLVKDLINYLNYFHSKEKYCFFSIDYDDKDKDEEHFHCLSFSEQYEKVVSKKCIIDYWNVARMANISISFKILCQINVPIQISIQNPEEPLNTEELILSVPYSGKYTVAQLMDDARKSVHKIYKDEMDICGFEVIQDLEDVKTWNSPLFCHKIKKESHDLESLQFKVVLRRHTKDCQRCKYAHASPACQFALCGLRFMLCSGI